MCDFVVHWLYINIFWVLGTNHANKIILGF